MLTNEKLKSSISAKWHIHNISSYTAVMVIFLGIMLSIASYASLIREENFSYVLHITGIVFLFFLIPILPFIVYEIHKYRSLLKDIEKYELCEAKLDRPSTSSFARGAVYYTVSFTTADGEQITTDTKSMWSSSIFAKNQLEKYNNKTVTLAYDKENNRLIVIELKK